MKADTWFPLYVADYLRDTMHLTRDQHGAYLLLLMAAWVGGGRLPNTPATLAAICKADRQEWRRLSPVILPFFRVEGAELVHGRVLLEFEKAQRLSDARRDSGKKGGRPRGSKKTNSFPVAFDLVTENPDLKKQNETPARVARPSPTTYQTLTESESLPLSASAHVEFEIIRDGVGDVWTTRLKHLSPLEALLVADPACTAAEIYSAAEAAAAWFRERGGKMTNWDLARDMALEARDKRLAGVRPPKAPKVRAPPKAAAPPPMLTTDERFPYFRDGRNNVPPEVRAEIAAATSEEWAASYIDQCAWCAGTFIARDGFAADKIKGRIGTLLAARKWFARAAKRAAS